ncbi:MAG TPA: phosphatase PAP2 family protein [Leeuwenhoekiella sp.]|nr:phosphatase PAP2 family protein [Leeuwenhoekiella sp.]
MNTLQELDTELFLYLNNLGSVPWDGLWLGITNKWYSIPVYVLLLLLIIKNLGLKKTGLVLVLVALLITCTDQLANVFKHGFERPRPCQLDVLRQQARFIAVRCGRYGYFSAHAASSMALAIFIGVLLRKKLRYLLPLLILWACTIGYSRIYVGVHYPGDVLTGMLIGGLLGYLFYLLCGLVSAKLKLNENHLK